MDERQVLIERANSLGLKFPKNIGDEKLAARIAAREAEIASAKNTQPVEGISGAAAENGHAPQVGASDAPTDSDPPTAGSMVTVIGPQHGRRRIGRRFGQEPVDIPAEDLSEAEFDALMSDPTLAVSVS